MSYVRDASGLGTLTKEEFLVALGKFGLQENRVIREALIQVLHSQGTLEADDGGLQIEQHIFPVAIDVACFLAEYAKLDPEIVATALLHDVLEDDRCIDEVDFRERFGSRIYGNVKLLTKLDWRGLQGESESEKKDLRDRIYFENLVTAPEEVIIVKLADRLNNVKRLESSPERSKRERYIKETVDHYLPLAAKHSSYFYNRISDELHAQGHRSKNRYLPFLFFFP